MTRFSRRLQPLPGLASLTAALLATACTVATDPIPTSQVQALTSADLLRVYQPQEPLEAPLTVYDAMARVLKYNLDNRLKLMEEALAMRQVNVATLSLLPQITTSAGYVNRSNVLASSSQSITTGAQSLETSTSQEQDRQVADLSVTWNILDFGVSYVAAKQQSDRALIVAERRRKVVHNILQDTRLVYWRAVAAERLGRQIGPLFERIDGALRDSRIVGEQRLGAPLEALTYQRQLLRTRQRLLELQRDLQVAKTQLATLMGQPPATELRLAIPDRDGRKLPTIGLSPEQIEEVALSQRPELVEEAYQARIGRLETQKAMLRMLPGIELNVGLDYDSNDFLLNNSWANYGARVVWNLFNVITGPARVALAETQEQFIDSRRVALAMAVLTQSRVSWLRFRQAQESWEVAHELEDIDGRIQRQISDEVAAQRRGGLDAIQADFDLLIANLTADLSFAEAENAAGNILVTMGYDPLPPTLSSDDVAQVAGALQRREAAWFAGTLPAFDPPAGRVPLAAADDTAAVDTAAAAPAAEETALDRLLAMIRPAAAPETPAAAPVASTDPAAAPATAPAALPAPAPAVPADIVKAALRSDATAGAAFQAHLGTYASARLARQSWAIVVTRLGDRLPGAEPVLVETSRRSDGKPFVLLRTAAFPSEARAEQFCQALRQGAGDPCQVVPAVPSPADTGA